jgi:hypothetical protein
MHLAQSNNLPLPLPLLAYIIDASRQIVCYFGAIQHVASSVRYSLSSLYQIPAARH